MSRPIDMATGHTKRCDVCDKPIERSPWAYVDVDGVLRFVVHGECIAGVAERFVMLREGSPGSGRFG